MLDKLKQALGEELASQVTEKLGDIELGIVNDGSLVPADKHDAMKKELSQAKEELTLTTEKLEQTSKTFEALKNDAQSADEIKSQLDAALKANEDFKAEADTRVANLQKRYAVEKGLAKANANPDAIDMLLEKVNLEEVTLDKEGNVVDWDTHLKPLKESRASLFGEVTFEGNNPASNNNTTDTRDSLVAKYNKAEKDGNVAAMMSYGRQIKELKQ